jgi:hypothetical protein
MRWLSSADSTKCRNDPGIRRTDICRNFGISGHHWCNILWRHSVRWLDDCRKRAMYRTQCGRPVTPLTEQTHKISSPGQSVSCLLSKPGNFPNTNQDCCPVRHDDRLFSHYQWVAALTALTKVTHSSAPLHLTSKLWNPHPHAPSLLPSNKSCWSHWLPSSLNNLPKCNSALRPNVQFSPASDLSDPTWSFFVRSLPAALDHTSVHGTSSDHTTGFYRVSKNTLTAMGLSIHVISLHQPVLQPHSLTLSQYWHTAQNCNKLHWLLHMELLRHVNTHSRLQKYR